MESNFNNLPAGHFLDMDIESYPHPSIWVEFWNQNESYSVPKLSTFSLRKAMMTLEATILNGKKTRPLLCYQCTYSLYEKLRIFIEDEDLAPMIVEYHSPKGIF